MIRSTTAVLLSALVLPGAGQLYLKRYWRGLGLIGVSLVCLGSIVMRTLQHASAIILQVESEGNALDAVRLAELIDQTQSPAGSSSYTVSALVLAVCWVVGIIDAHRPGNRNAA